MSLDHIPKNKAKKRVRVNFQDGTSRVFYYITRESGIFDCDVIR